LLRKDGIFYKIKQIAGYIDMQKVNQTCIEGNEDVSLSCLPHL